MTDLSQQSDEKLIAACRSGNEAAWNALIDRYERLVYTVPSRYGLTPTEVEDVFQSVWLSLLKNLSNLRQPDRVAAWLVTTARRECWERRRGGEYERTISTEPETLTFDKQSDDMSPEELVDLYRRQQLLRDAVQELDGRCRQLLFHLYYDSEFPSYAEIAEELDMPIGSIGPVRARCLKKLRDMLAGTIGEQ